MRGVPPGLLSLYIIFSYIIFSSLTLLIFLIPYPPHFSHPVPSHFSYLVLLISSFLSRPSHPAPPIVPRGTSTRSRLLFSFVFRAVVESSLFYILRPSCARSFLNFLLLSASLTCSFPSFPSRRSLFIVPYPHFPLILPSFSPLLSPSLSPSLYLYSHPIPSSSSSPFAPSFLLRFTLSRHMCPADFV